MPPRNQNHSSLLSVPFFGSSCSISLFRSARPVFFCPSLLFNNLFEIDHLCQNNEKHSCQVIDCAILNRKTVKIDFLSKKLSERKSWIFFLFLIFLMMLRLVGTIVNDLRNTYVAWHRG